ncbi:hypothetical protein F4778DRAFT_780509 [Xylariomycetidae sp. FL2044]|nr:hypothetical protein F4778DRAFT_780509 [Xylariomycetidae sp. FL2044]
MAVTTICTRIMSLSVILLFVVSVAVGQPADTRGLKHRPHDCTCGHGSSRHNGTAMANATITGFMPYRPIPTGGFVGQEVNATDSVGYEYSTGESLETQAWTPPILASGARKDDFPEMIFLAAIIAVTAIPSQPTRDIHDVIVVGGGAAGVSVILSLLRKKNEGWVSKSFILVNEDQHMGPGHSYSTTANSGTIVNRPDRDMSIVDGQTSHFSKWHMRHRDRHGDYPRRGMYGVYLEACLAEGTEVAAELGKATFPDQSTLLAKHVVLALGSFSAQKYGHLPSARYFPSPWPTKRLGEIRRNAAVGVIGTNASAIDVIRVLYEQRHQGKIYMMSRRGRLPKVEANELETYPRAYMMHTVARRLEKGECTLDNAIDALEAEVRRYSGMNLHTMECLQSKMDTFFQLTKQIKAAEAGNPKCQQVIDAFRPVVDRCWQALGSEDKEKLLDTTTYAYPWSIYRETMPVENARILRAMMQRRQLQIVKGDTVEFADDKFALGCDPAPVHADYVVEATGLEFDVEKVPSKLVQRLLSRRDAVAHKLGGIQVSSADLKVREGMYAIGSLTKGTHCFSHDIQHIVRHASRIADSIAGRPPTQPLQIALFVGLDLFNQMIMMEVVPRLLEMGHMPFIFHLRDLSSLHLDETYHFFEHDLLQYHVVPYHTGRGGGKPSLSLFSSEGTNPWGVFVSHDDETPTLQTLKEHAIDMGVVLGRGLDCGKEIPAAIPLFQLLPGLHPFYYTAEQVYENKEKRYGYSLVRIAVAPGVANALQLTEGRDIAKASCACSALFDCHDIGVRLVLEAVQRTARKEPFATVSAMNLEDLIRMGLRLGEDEEDDQLPAVDSAAMIERVGRHFMVTPQARYGLGRELEGAVAKLDWWSDTIP